MSSSNHLKVTKWTWKIVRRLMTPDHRHIKSELGRRGNGDLVVFSPIYHDTCRTVLLLLFMHLGQCFIIYSLSMMCHKTQLESIDDLAVSQSRVILSRSVN